MLFLIALILAAAFAFLCGRPLKKSPALFYLGAVAISVASVALAAADLRSAPIFVSTYLVGLFTRGAFATGLWAVVMWMGALPNGSAPMKKLMPIRGELSIFAAIFTLGHNIGFGQTYFVRLFTDSGRMAWNHKIAGILSIAMLVIMIPLTIMSFKGIRRKIKPKLWKNIQRTAYAFYAMIYIHVLVLYYPMAKAGREGIFLNIAIYSLVFLGYAAFRIRKAIVIKRKPQKKTVLNIVTTIAFVAAFACVLLIFKKGEKTETPKKTAYTYTISVTTTAPVGNQIKNTTATSVAKKLSASVANAQKSTTTAADNKDEPTETTTDITADDPGNEDAPADDVPENNNDNEVTQPEENPDIPSVPEEPSSPVYVYRNGTYSGSSYGYDGDVFVEITLENDVIVSVSAWTEESDDSYFDKAQGAVISAILSSQSTDVDAVSGATYSSEAIMAAMQKALDSAKN